MIFASRNEEGVPAYEAVFNCDKTVTRREKPQPVGAIRAVQPGRGKKSICKIKILSCAKHITWRYCRVRSEKDLEEEAHKEGFRTWQGLLKWFDDKNIDIDVTYRIEFERI